MAEVVVDPSTLRTRTPGGNVTGTVCLKFGGEHFPDSQWNDFPVIVLGWWIGGLLDVVHDRAETFEGMFMDGPYSFVVEAAYGVSAKITLRSPETSLTQTINLRALLASAASAGAAVAHECRANGWANADLTQLEVVVARAAA